MENQRNGTLTAEGRPKPQRFATSIVEGETIQLSVGNLQMQVQPNLGGRIIGFRLGGREVLTGPSVVAAGEEELRNMYGSTFWTSPQAAWGWPPEAEVDRLPYSVSMGDQELSLTGKPGVITGYSVSKRFVFNDRAESINVEYSLLNQSAALPAAPWEISRVQKRGLVLFPSDSTPAEHSTLKSVMTDGIAWLDISKAPTGDSKLFQNGSEGWLAYVHDGLVLIKTFENIDPAEQADGEAEIEIFISGDYDYAELEQQGRYSRPAPGATTQWTVGWWLRALPSGMSVTPGDEALVNWIREVIAGGRQ